MISILNKVKRQLIYNYLELIHFKKNRNNKTANQKRHKSNLIQTYAIYNSLNKVKYQSQSCLGKDDICSKS